MYISVDITVYICSIYSFFAFHRMDRGTTTSFFESVNDETYLITDSNQVTCYNGSKMEEGKYLHRHMTFKHAFAFIVTAMIGTGLFISPSLVARRTPNMFLAIVVWMLAGFCALLGSLCYSELASIIKRTGSSYIFIFECYGKVPAFVTIWTNALIVAPCVSTVIAYTAGTYVCAIFIDDESSQMFIWCSKLVALILLYFSIVLNCVGVKTSGNIQSILVLMQALVVIMIVSFGIYEMSITKSLFNLAPDVMFNNTLSGLRNNLPALGSAMFNALWCFDGWYMIAHFVEEIINPKRNIPLLAFTSIPTVTFLYVLINIACLMVLSQQEMTSSTIFVTKIAKKVAGSNFANIVPVFVVTSSVGALISFCYQLPRFILSAAREGQFPSIFGLIHRTRRTPIPAVIYIGAVGTVITLTMAEQLEAIIQYTNIALWLEYAVVMSTLLVFRYTRPEVERCFRVLFIIPIFIICVALSLVIASLITSPLGACIVILLMSVGIPVYYVCLPKNWLSFLRLDLLCIKICERTSMVVCVVDERSNN